MVDVFVEKRLSGKSTSMNGLGGVLVETQV